jgi:hypothetical protein
MNKKRRQQQANALPTHRHHHLQPIKRKEDNDEPNRLVTVLCSNTKNKKMTMNLIGLSSTTHQKKMMTNLIGLSSSTAHQKKRR